MLKLMIDGADAELALHGAKRRLDLRQSEVALPEHRGFFCGQVGAQQVVPIAELGFVMLLADPGLTYPGSVGRAV